MEKLNRKFVVNGVFITGTTTNIGKTFVSAWLMTHFNCSYWKPVQSGIPRDTKTVEAIDVNFITYKEKYILSTPSSPHFAAKIDKINVSINDILETLERLNNEALNNIDEDNNKSCISNNEISLNKQSHNCTYEYIKAKGVIIEGAGGILSPLNDTHLFADLIKSIKLPIIIVSDGKLGAINQVCMTVLAAKHYGIPILGVILSGEVLYNNDEAIQKFALVRILGVLPKIHNICKRSLLSIKPTSYLINIMKKQGISLRTI